VTHNLSTIRTSRGTADPRAVRVVDDAEHVDQVGDERPVARSTVGWRYGSALAAARALNARPAASPVRA
jgi:hypothetical protein